MFPSFTSLLRRFSPPDGMIGGFNTDIVLEGVVYHIQTEDKGAKTREIVTHIFREGEVIFTRRTPYPAAAEPSRLDFILEALVRTQHLKLLQFVRAGGMKRKDLMEKILATASHGGESPATLEPEDEVETEPEPEPEPKPLPLHELPHAVLASAAPEPPIAVPEELRNTRSIGSPVISALRQASSLRVAKASDALPTAATSLPRRESAPGGEPKRLAAVESSAKPAPQEQVALNDTAEWIIDDFLKDLARAGGVEREKGAATSAVAEIDPGKAKSEGTPLGRFEEPEEEEGPPFSEGEKCEIQLMSSSTILSGEVQLLSVRLQSDRQQLPIADAKVAIKIYGKTIRPIAYEGRSDRQGIFSLEIIVPHYTVGDGHVEVQAHTLLGERVLRLEVTRSSAAK